MLHVCSLAETNWLKNGRQYMQRTNLLAPCQLAQVHRLLRDVREAESFQPQRLDGKPAVHIVDIVHVTGRPQPFGNGRGTRPNARIDILRRGLLGPFVGSPPRMRACCSGVRPFV